MPQLVWLVTGCSSGFGAEFVKAILQRGDRAIATARNINTLSELSELGAATLQLDVTAPMSELQDKVQQAIKIYGHIDVYISNAGYAQLGAVEELGDDLLKQLQTNTFGSMNVTTAIMPHWRERKSGYLVINSSFLAWWNTAPGLGAYAAAKAALSRLVTAFSAEVAALGYIKTLTIYPGHCRSEIAASHKHSDFLSKPSPNYQPLHDFWSDFAPKLHGNQPGDVSKACNLTIDLVRGEGKAAGRQVPAEMWMGSDAFVDVKASCEATLNTLKEWEDVIRSTDIVAAA